MALMLAHDSSAGLAAASPAYVRVEIAATHPEFPHWSRPVQVYFRREAASWTLVGLEREVGAE